MTIGGTRCSRAQQQTRRREGLKGREGLPTHLGGDPENTRDRETPRTAPDASQRTPGRRVQGHWRKHDEFCGTASETQREEPHSFTTLPRWLRRARS
eukprot:6979687-Prorocentrum_lima.AAC.1